MSGGEWLTSYDSSMDDGLFVWTRTVITFTDDREPIVTEAIRASGLPGAKGDKGDNGEHSVDYKVTTSHFFVVWNANGEVLTPVDNITFKVIKTVGSDISPLYNLSADNLVLWIDLGGEVSKISVLENSIISPSKITDYLTLYLCPSSVTSFADAKVNYISMAEVKAVHQEKGDDGTSGPVIYPAGEYDSNKIYTGTAKKAPYVFFDSDDENVRGYYIAYGTPDDSPEYSLLDGEPDWSNVPTDIGSWVKMETYNAIYSDIGVFGHALVGKWVFHGDYMFSQNGSLNPEGPDYNGSWKIDYATFINKYDSNLEWSIANGSFIPNICFNSVTGEAWFSGKGIRFHENDTVSIGINNEITFHPVEGLKIGDFVITDGGFEHESNGNLFKINPNGLEISSDDGATVSSMYCSNASLSISSANAEGVLNCPSDPTGILINGNTTGSAVQCNSGMFYGFRPKTRTVPNSQSLSIYDHTIIVDKLSITLTLPKMGDGIFDVSPNLLGQTYKIIAINNVTVTGDRIYHLSSKMWGEDTDNSISLNTGVWEIVRGTVASGKYVWFVYQTGQL